MERWIIIRFEGSGFHRWEDAPSKYAHLQNMHHHTFRVVCRIEVPHPLRKIEFISAASSLRSWFQNALDNDIDFRSMSCETMAERIAGRVRGWWEPKGFIKVEVTEDGIHGGGYGIPSTTS